MLFLSGFQRGCPVYNEDIRKRPQFALKTQEHEWKWSDQASHTQFILCLRTIKLVYVCFTLKQPVKDEHLPTENCGQSTCVLSCRLLPERREEGGGWKDGGMREKKKRKWVRTTALAELGANLNFSWQRVRSHLPGKWMNSDRPLA